MSALEDKLICPITHQLFREPVVALDGHTYERQAIQAWFRKHTTSPLTNELIGPQIVPSHGLRQLVAEFMEQHPDSEQYQLQPEEALTLPSPGLTNEEFLTQVMVIGAERQLISRQCLKNVPQTRERIRKAFRKSSKKASRTKSKTRRIKKKSTRKAKNRCDWCSKEVLVGKSLCSACRRKNRSCSEPKSKCGKCGEWYRRHHRRCRSKNTKKQHKKTRKERRRTKSREARKPSRKCS